jgi:hypothetical protein
MVKLMVGVGRLGRLWCREVTGDCGLVRARLAAGSDHYRLLGGMSRLRGLVVDDLSAWWSLVHYLDHMLLLGATARRNLSSRRRRRLLLIDLNVGMSRLARRAGCDGLARLVLDVDLLVMGSGLPSPTRCIPLVVQHRHRLRPSCSPYSTGRRSRGCRDNRCGCGHARLLVHNVGCVVLACATCRASRDVDCGAVLEGVLHQLLDGASARLWVGRASDRGGCSQYVLGGGVRCRGVRRGGRGVVLEGGVGSSPVWMGPDGL